MYVHPAFKVHPAASLAFAAARGFGLVIATDGGRPVASPLPFRLIEQDGKMPKLEFHVARANPLGQIAEKGGTWLVAVHGHDAYVSPDWYASAEQVPTWLYALSPKFESWLAPKTPWLLDKVADRRREMLLAAIVAVEMTVETVEGAFKLNQHKQDEDHLAIASALSRQDDPSSRAIAQRMIALRPNLDYHRGTPSLPAAGSTAPALVAAK
jgi:transcriptional regulator